VEKSIWKKGVRENASVKDLGPCHRVERRVYTKKGEGLLIVKRGKRGGVGICGRLAEERLYPTL